ncbi:hypothetical protein NHX12_011602 [Muraenolepis orangiensis]|uniref:Neurotransmitter-gated ion-channel ligand-binding domain-containing protein n=1 Tax=Muraenolepis orangiensis TaxID=630683 RepID=A0A9Q0DGH4_9TELE|nr:hypothetical protein NHX12_011602 [Muraenolepis orangiensis]
MTRCRLDSVGFFLLMALSFRESLQGEHQRKLYKELLANYNRLERPVVNDSTPLLVELGLTLLQIIDVGVNIDVLPSPSLEAASPRAGGEMRFGLVSAPNRHFHS